jgi:hypothetical protein
MGGYIDFYFELSKKAKPTNNVDCDEKEEKKTIHLVDEIATAVHSHVVAHSMQKAPSCFT